MALALLVTTVTLGKMQSPLSANLVRQITATVTLARTSALPNQYVEVTGENFTTGGAATIASISLGGTVVDTSKINFGAPVTVDSSGNFVTNLVVPVNSPALTPGSYSLSVIDSAGVSASATLRTASPTISVSPTSSRAGSTITVTGANFPLNISSPGTDQVPLVSINYNIATDNPQTVVSIFPDSTGAFTTTFQVPLDVTIPSTSNKVTMAMSGTSFSATTTHSVTVPIVTGGPTTGTTGTAITITRTDFNAFIPVKSLSIGGVQVEMPINMTTGVDGKFTLSGTVPKLESGTHPILVQVGDSTYTLTFTSQGGSSTTGTTELNTNPTIYQLTQELRP